MNRYRELVAVAAAAVGSLAAAGCHVDTHKQGDSDNVKIATPFGGMQVKTNDEVVKSGIGLPDYPGAVLVKKDKDNGAADINMSFGSFQMRIKAQSYRTGDDPSKVEAFYRDALKRYGDVIECVDNRTVGTPSRTAEGLTCDAKSGKQVEVSGGAERELKAGSEKHQHIVSIKREGSGTKFGLVALDLPGQIHWGKDDEGGKESQ